MTTSRTVGAHVRPAAPADAADLARVHRQSWQEAYTGLLGEEVLRTQAEHAGQQWAARLADPFGPHYWLAQREQSVVGLAWAEGVGPGQPAPLELVAMYVLASEYGTGTATALLTATIGDAPCFLWVAQGNARAQAFYRRHGFRADGAARTEAAWGDITVLRMVR